MYAYEFSSTNYIAPAFGDGCKAPAWSGLNLCARRMNGSFAEPSSLWPMMTRQKPRYEIACDRSFHTKQANVSVRDSTGERSLQIEAQNGRWFENGRENQTVKGAVDIDLGWSPSTNTLPIKRLKLEIGQTSGEFIAAWVRFPELTLQPLPQEYLRLGRPPISLFQPRRRIRGKSARWMTTIWCWTMRDSGSAQKAPNKRHIVTVVLAAKP